MEKSAGLVIILDETKILLVHPTGSAWNSRLSFPKGHIDDNETSLEAAIRETKEETGINIPDYLIDKFEYQIKYKDKNGKVYKTVFYFLVKINSPDWININGNENLVVDENNLQLDEIDWAGFLNKEESEDKIFWRFKEILGLLN